MNPVRSLQVLADEAGANPALPSSYEIAAIVLGFLFIAALVAAGLMVIVGLARGLTARRAAGSGEARMRDELAGRAGRADSTE